MIHYTFDVSFQCGCDIMPGLMTHYTLDIQAPNLTNNNNRFITFSIYNYLLEIFAKFQAFQNWRKPHKQSFLPLVCAINHSIYYFMNGNVNHSHDIHYLIKRLLLTFQRFITKRDDFSYNWFSLLLSGLLKSQHISLWVMVIFFRQLYLIRRRYLIRKLIQFLNKIKNLIMAHKKFIILLLLYINLILLWVWSIFISHYSFSISKHNINSNIQFIGGGSSARTDYETLKPFVIPMEVQLQNPEDFNYIYDGHCIFDKAMQKIQVSGESYILCNIPLFIIAEVLTTGQANEIAKEHNLHALSRKSLADKRAVIKSHICTKTCAQCLTLFWAVRKNKKNIQRKSNTKANQKIAHPIVGKISSLKSSRIVRNHKYYIKDNIKFPPSPLSKRLMHKIISGFCNDTHFSKFEEAGCAVCGRLVVISKLIKLSDIKCSLDPLVRTGVTRLPQNSTDNTIKEISGPIIDTNCKHACYECVTFLEKKVMPPMALANGLWVGNIPKELSDLTFVERLLVARIRSNRCIVHVLKGGWKMRANAIMFPTPVPKLCNILPPPIEELDEVIAFMFTGIAQPTSEDMKRTPMLARRRYISAALEWLKVNHSDYADVQISQDNLKCYPEEGPPVTIDYRSSIINKHKEATSVFDMEEEDGVENGECPFVVHGITGENYSTLSKDATRALALQHLIKDQNILFVGHGSKPESMFNNSQLFPSMMPWLFPYGLGGIGNSKIVGRMSSIAQKKYLLMYHDKRFQTDPAFPLIAFNQEQIQESSSAGFVTAEKPYFAEVAKRLMTLDKSVLEKITDRMMKGE